MRCPGRASSVKVGGMQARARDLETNRTSNGPWPLDPLVLARLAAGSVTRAELQRDIAALIEPHVPASDMKTSVDEAIAALERRGAAIHEGRGRWRLAEDASGEVAELLKTAGSAPGDWANVRNIRLVAVALGLGPVSGQRVRALSRPEGLRAIVLQQAYDLPKRAAASPAKIRAQLAVIALERAFGNKIKGGLGAGDGLSPKAGRLLAAQLSRQPRDFGTDGRLVAALAAEAVEATRYDIEGLRLAILRRWVGRLLGKAPAAKASEPIEVPVRLVAQPAPAATVSAPKRPAAAARPDLKGFAEAVQAAARTRATGWPGNLKAYVSHVWQALAERHPDWGLSEIEFKSMLAEAHRTGHVMLSNADLKDRANLADIQRSAVVYKNTVWHLVRIED